MENKTNLLSTYVPSWKTETEEFRVFEGSPMAIRAKDYAVSKLKDMDDMVSIPVFITRDRVENRLVEVVQSKSGMYSFDTWQKFLTLHVREFQHNIEFLPTAAEIRSVMGEDFDADAIANADSIASIYNEAMARRHRDTIATKFIKDNYMYYMQRHISASSNLVSSLSYSAVRELALLYNKLFIEANQAITPKQQVDTIGRISTLMESGDSELTPEASQVLSSFISMASPLNMSSVKMIPVPKHVAVNILAELGLCSPSAITMEQRDLFPGDSLIRTVDVRVTVEKAVLEAVRDINLMQVFEFLLSKIETRRFGLGFRPLERYRNSVLESLKAKVAGDPTFTSIHFAEPGKPGRETQIELLADDILNTLWQNEVFDHLYKGIQNNQNPLYMKLQISNENLSDVAPGTIHVTSALQLAYSLFSKVNGTLIDVFNYEALDRNWFPMYEAINDEVRSRFDMLRGDDDSSPAYVFASMNMQVPNNVQHFFKPKCSLDVPEALVLPPAAEGDVDDFSGHILYQDENSVYKRRALVRKGVDIEQTLSVAEFFVPEYSHLMTLHALLKVGAVAQMDIVRMDKKEIMVDLPQWATRLHSLFELGSATREVVKMCRMYSIEFELVDFPSMPDFVEFLGGELMLSDFKRLGYDIERYVTPSTSVAPKFFVHIKSNPVLIRHFWIPSIDLLFDTQGLTEFRGKDLNLANADDLMVSVLPVDHKNDSQVIIPRHVIHLESMLIGKFVTKASVEVIKKEVKPLTASINLDGKKQTPKVSDEEIAPKSDTESPEQDVEDKKDE